MSIEDQIKTFILKNLYFADGARLKDDASFLAEGIIDSMGALELVAFVESEFAIKVDPSEVVVKNFDSVNRLADFVRRKLGLPGDNSPKPVEDAAEGRQDAPVGIPTVPLSPAQRRNGP